MVLVIIATAVVNVGLGFALAVYAARRSQLLVTGGAGSAPGAAFGSWPLLAAGPDGAPASSAELGPSSPEIDAAMVEGLQEKVEEFHQQLTDAEAVIAKA